METIIKAVVRILAVVDGDMLRGWFDNRILYDNCFLPEGMINAIPQDRW